MSSETKRQNAGPKVTVALPKPTSSAVDSSPTSSQMVFQEAALHAAIGSRVRISTAAPSQSTVEGTIYVADPITNLLILNVSPTQNSSISASSLTAPAGSYRIIPISQIATFQLQALPLPQSQPSPDSSSTHAQNTNTNTLDIAALQTRLSREIAKLQSMQSKQGPKGTSPADQALFDSLSRTMPTQWHGNTIIVSDTYIIDKPYNPANIRLITGASGDLDRMRRVLDLEKKRVTLKMDKTMMDHRSAGSGDLKGQMKKGG